MKIFGFHIIKDSKLRIIIEKARAEQRRLNKGIVSKLLRLKYGAA